LRGTAAIIAAILAFNALGWAAAGGRPLVVVSIEPVACLVWEVGGPYVAVVSLVPEGVEFHSYILRPEDIKRAASADVVVVTGHLGWEERLVEALRERGSKAVVLDILHDLRDKLVLLKFPSSNETNLHGYWLHPANAIVIAEEIASILARVDPGHADYYAAAVERLRRGVAGLLEEARRVGSAAFVITTPPEQYVLEGLGFRVVASLTTGELCDVTPGRLEEVRRALERWDARIAMSDLARMLPVYAYVEELSAETGRPVVELKTVGLTKLRSYVALMAYNLAAVATGGGSCERAGGFEAIGIPLTSAALVAAVIVVLTRGVGGVRCRG